MRRLSSGFAWFILAAIFMAAAPFATYADSIPAADISAGAAYGTQITTVGTVNGSYCDTGAGGGCQSSTMTVSYANGGASASGSGSTSGGTETAGTVGTGEVVGFFEVVGSSSEDVPLIFTASGSTSVSGATGEAVANFYEPGGELMSCSAIGGDAGACVPGEASSFSGSLNYNATPGVLYDFEILASGDAVLGSGSWSASVDGTVEIAPTFADASDFTLEFSANPTTTTPEPSSLLLLGSGLLGLLGLAARSKRRTLSALC